MNQAQHKAYMSTYIKNMGRYTLQKLEVLRELQKQNLIMKKKFMFKPYRSNIPSLTARDNLVMLWSLVKKRFSLTEPTDDKERTLWVELKSLTEPTDDKERTLWVELKRLFEPDTDDTLWNLQRYMHDPLTWRLYDTCGVYRVSKEKGMDIFMLVEKEYPLLKGILSLMLVKKLLVDQYSEMENELLRKIFIQASRPKLYSVWKHPLSTNGLI
nr:hypothetical protein [Tanacetum cinerariifolium]